MASKAAMARVASARRSKHRPSKPSLVAKIPTGFDPVAYLATAGVGRTLVTLDKNQTLFTQGGTADSVFYIQRGKIKLTVVSANGKEATIALLGPGDFVGEGCVAAVQPLRLATATALTDCGLLRIARKDMVRA